MVGAYTRDGWEQNPLQHAKDKAIYKEKEEASAKVSHLKNDLYVRLMTDWTRCSLTYTTSF